MRNKFGLILVFLLLASPAFAATQLKKTVMPSGGDYTSLEACMNANEQNLVTADKYFDVEIDGTWSSADTTAVTIHNYTTDATRYINIYTTAAARHKGIWSTSYYQLVVASGNGISVGINQDSSKITINGLQVTANNGYEITGGCIFLSNYQANVTIINNILKSGGGTGLAAPSMRGTSKIYNNIIYNATGSWAVGITTIGSTAGSTYTYNNTIYNCHGGVYRMDGYFSNNLIMNCSYACIRDVSYIDVGSNNATSDATGDDSPLTSGLVNKTSYSDYFVSVTGGSEDLHLKSTATDFIGAGADLSASFTTDIDGETRSSWDIGADEYSSGTPPAVVPSPYYYQMLMGG